MKPEDGWVEMSWDESEQGNFNQGRKFFRGVWLSDSLKTTLNDVIVNVTEMGVEGWREENLFEKKAGSSYFVFARVWSSPRREGDVIYRPYKWTLFTPSTFHSITLFNPFYLFYLFCVTGALTYAEKNLHRGVLGRDSQRPRRQTGSKHERRGWSTKTVLSDTFQIGIVPFYNVFVSLYPLSDLQNGYLDACRSRKVENSPK